MCLECWCSVTSIGCLVLAKVIFAIRQFVRINFLMRLALGCILCPFQPPGPDQIWHKTDSNSTHQIMAKYLRNPKKPYSTKNVLKWEIKYVRKSIRCYIYPLVLNVYPCDRIWSYCFFFLYSIGVLVLVYLLAYAAIHSLLWLLQQLVFHSTFKAWFWRHEIKSFFVVSCTRKTWFKRWIRNQKTKNNLMMSKVTLFSCLSDWDFEIRIFFSVSLIRQFDFFKAFIV